MCATSRPPWWSGMAPTGTSTGTDRWSWHRGHTRYWPVPRRSLVDVERAGLDDQPLGQLEVYAPVARLVGIGQRRASDRRADAHVVKLAGLSRQAYFDIAQALAVGQLREGHDAKLLGATEAARPVIAAVTIDDAMEGLPRQEVHDLREQGLAEVHGNSGVAKPGTLAQTASSDSSRRQ